MNIDTILDRWDGEELFLHRDAPSGAWFIIAIHNSRRGPGSGGTRMKTYPSLVDAVQDATLLAESMTYKFAVADLPRGGGKGVIALPADFDPAQRDEVLRRYGSFVGALGGRFGTGPDVGTGTADMDLIAETGGGAIFGLSAARGGSGDTGPTTALGVYVGIEALCEWLYESSGVRRRRILVQGAGSVGGGLIQLLQDGGAEVLFSEVDPLQIAHFQARGARFVAPEAVWTTACDVLAPCALGGVLNGETIPLLQCRGIAGAANNQLAPPQEENARRLRERGIVYVPDYVINFGGALGVVAQEILGWSREQTLERICAVRDTVRQILATAEAEGITTEAAARQLAQGRLENT